MENLTIEQKKMMTFNKACKEFQSMEKALKILKNNPNALEELLKIYRDNVKVEKSKGLPQYEVEYVYTYYKGYLVKRDVRNIGLGISN